MRSRSLIVARRLPLLTLLVLATAVTTTVAGCDLMIAKATPRPSRLVATPQPPPEATPTELEEVPTIRPEPSGDGPDLIDAASALADLDSYRVAVESRGLVPATRPDGTVTMTSTLIQGADPAAAFTMTGVDGFVDGRLEAVVIGDTAWLKEGSRRWIRSPGGAADFDAAFTTLSPIDLVTEFEGLSPAMGTTGTERLNGIRSVRYHAASNDDAAAAAGLIAGSVDLWLAADGRYLVGLGIDGTWDLDGTPTLIHLRIDVSRVDDRANKVVPPG